MKAVIDRFLGIFAGLLLLVSFMITSAVMPSAPVAPMRAAMVMHLDRSVSRTAIPSVLPAPVGLHEVRWKVGSHPYPHITWGSVSGATVYELRTAHFDRVLKVRSATVYLGPGTYSAQVRAGRSSSDIHGHWSASLTFRVGVYVPPGSSHEASALRWALTRIGDPYVWAAAGPGSFDCSGLVLWSYKQIGIYLPHKASMQYGYGVHISRANLQPGDLVFFYGLGHVGIYVGGGKMVDAPRPGEFVRIDTVYWSSYNGATRIT